MTPIMKKILLIILLAFFSTGAMAAWKYIAKDKYKYTVYIELNSIEKQGSTVIVWELFDYGEPQADLDSPPNSTYLSSKARAIYDCKKETMKFLALLYHKEQMGKGELISMYIDESVEYPIPPYTLIEKLYKAACGKK